VFSDPLLVENPLASLVKEAPFKPAVDIFKAMVRVVTPLRRGFEPLRLSAMGPKSDIACQLSLN
jgi:hypothetical protein